MKNVVKNNSDCLESVYRSHKCAHTVWISKLESYRRENPLLNLFANRQIMILIILLTKSTTQSKIKCQFLEKLSISKEIINDREKELKITIRCLIHYLRSLKITNVDLSENNMTRLYKRYEIELNVNVEITLEMLSQFLQNIFRIDSLTQQDILIHENEQYLVVPTTIKRIAENSPLEHDLDIETCCILLNLFKDSLPSAYQILWCSIATEDDIHLFFSRLRIFSSLVFVVMGIDKMHHRLREVLLNEQDALTREKQYHGSVYYFSRELTTSRKGLKLFPVPPKYRDPYHSYQHLVQLFRQTNFVQPQIRAIYGKAGTGKFSF